MTVLFDQEFLFCFRAHKVMHDQSFEGFECTECGKRLHTKGSFTRHKMVAHSNARPFHCTECTKSFKTKKDLKVGHTEKRRSGIV